MYACYMMAMNREIKRNCREKEIKTESIVSVNQMALLDFDNETGSPWRLIKFMPTVILHSR